MRRIVLLLVPVALLAVSACGDDPDAEDVASATQPSASSAAPGAPAGTAPATDVRQRELQFVQCMREEGIEEMPDPVPGDGSGRSALLQAIDVEGMGGDPAFQAALEQCRDYLPPAPQEDQLTSEEREVEARWLDCLRENGLPDIPDQRPDGRPLQIVGAPADSVTDQQREEAARDGTYVYSRDDPQAMAAFETCHEYAPSEVLPDN